jgi:hypothetical protein
MPLVVYDVVVMHFHVIGVNKVCCLTYRLGVAALPLNAGESKCSSVQRLSTLQDCLPFLYGLPVRLPLSLTS